jgi:glycosyltransferase involved in cell wall biosynthesis
MAVTEALTNGIAVAARREIATPDWPSGIVFSAVVCTYNRYDLLPGAIESLRQQDAPANAVEIIVVDNSPNQTEAAAFGRRYADLPGLTYRTEATPGLANARNVGYAAAQGGIVAFIDDDARAAPSWAAALVAAHLAYDGHAGIVGGRVVPNWLGERPGWLGPQLQGYLSLLDLGGSRRELAAGEALVGCNLSFDRSALIAAGGFATNLGRIGTQATLLSNEEVEVCGRIRRDGKLAVYEPDAVVEHVIQVERLTQDWFRRRAAWQAVSDLIARPEDAPALAAKAGRRLAHPIRGRRRLGRLRDRNSAEALWNDMVLLYDATIVALCGGEPAGTPETLLGRLWRS